MSDRSSASLRPLRPVLWIVSGALAAVTLLLLGVSLLLPNRWHVEQTLDVNAPPSVIFPLLNDLRQWSQWENTQPDDPSVRYEVEGPNAGPGQVRRYRGQHSGTGLTRIVRSDPERGVWLQSAVGSDAPNAQSAITLHHAHGVTRVRWEDQGELPKITGPFLRDGIQRRLERHIERALKQLKTLAEQPVARR